MNVITELYESTTNPNIPYNQLYNNGELDTNVLMGLKRVPLDDKNKFIRGGSCNPDTSHKRYIVILRVYSYWASFFTPSTPSIKTWVRIDIQFKPYDISTSKGDFCTDAHSFSTEGFGNFESPDFGFLCHTKGEGYGEDGSNIGCLEQVSNYITTWVKVSVTGFQKADLSFSIEPTMNYYAEKVAFRLLYGECRALTPGPCISNEGSSFRLDCMPAGDYFLQVSIPSSAMGSFKVKVVATTPKYNECKPISLFEPLANFSFIPPCKNQEVQFNNWSTAGGFIRYHWDFGNGTTSTLKNPLINFTPQKDIDTFSVKLIVTNIRYQTKDSITKLVEVRKIPLDVKLFVLNDSSCFGKVVLEAMPNYTDISSIKWSPNPTVLEDSNRVATYLFNGNATIYVKVKQGDCEVQDFVRFSNIRYIPELIDTQFCPGSTFELDISDILSENNAEEWAWEDNSNAIVRTFDKPGIYSLTIKNGSCSWSGGFNLDYFSLSKGFSPKDTFACWGTQTLISINDKAKNIIWSTGENTQSIIVSQKGEYFVTAQIDNCLLSDTFTVEMKPFGNLLGFDDTLKCIEKPIWVFSKKKADFYDWNNESMDSVYKITRDGTHTLRVGYKHCDTTIVFNVAHYPSTLNLGNDSIMCEPVLLRIDASSGNKFIWQPTNEITQEIFVHDFGTYSVIKENHYGCTEMDTFNYLRDCGTILIAPNAFSPNGDGLNDVFLPYNERMVSFDFQVYNRWGELVFKSNNPRNGWDGKFNGIALQNGVYMFVVNYKYEENGIIKEGQTKGTVNLIR